MRKAFRLLLLLGFCITGCQSSTSTPGHHKVSAIDHAPAMQERRKKLIEEFTREKVFQKVESQEIGPIIWITPKFSALSYDNKKLAVRIVYEYYFTSNASQNTVWLKDDQSGKSVGSFSFDRGLQLE